MLKKEQVILNKAQCSQCKDIIESTHRHDFVRCSCGRISVDGGKDYIRRSFKKLEDIIELSVTKTIYNFDRSHPMQIAVSEALRLKNEIAGNVNRLQNLLNQTHVWEEASVSFGVETENGEVVSERDIPTFSEVFARLEKAFEYSNGINTALATHNVETGISEMVRRKSNIKALIKSLEGAIERSSPTKRTSKSELAGEVITTVTKFSPHTSKTELRAQVKALRRQVRELETSISKADNQTIEVPFGFENLEEVFDLI